MRYRRSAAAVIVLSTVLAATIWGACGGRTYGSLDDAGNYRDPNGAILFSPGGGCVDFDAGVLVNVDPNLYWGSWREFPNISCAKPEECVGILLSAKYPWLQSCAITQDSGHCMIQEDLGKFPGCSPGDDRDRYCQAFFQQFVKGSGIAQAKCVKCTDPRGCPHASACRTSCCNFAGRENGTQPCVLRDGVTRCELPCW